jgi:hypothetical protein
MAHLVYDKVLEIGKELLKIEAKLVSMMTLHQLIGRNAGMHFTTIQQYKQHLFKLNFITLCGLYGDAFTINKNVILKELEYAKEKEKDEK